MAMTLETKAATRLCRDTPASLDTLRYHEEEFQRSEEDQRCNDELCRLALEATSDGLWDWDVQTGKVFYSTAYLCMLGYDPGKAVSSLSFWHDLIHPDDRDRVLAVNLGCIEGSSEKFQLEYRMLARDGNWIWILGRGKCVNRDSSGRALRLVGTHEDITERKELEKQISQLVAEKDLILRDVHHRVKNNLSTLRSLLSLQSQSMRSKVAASALQVAAGRVQSMAVLYDRLYLSGDYGYLSSLDFVSELVDQILCNFPGYKNLSVIKEIEDIRLPQRTVTGLSLIINELLTNAMKYAFNNREMGLVRVCLYKCSGGFQLEIQDDGPGLAATHRGEGESGMGLMLIRTLIEQLKGRLELDGSAGTRIRMDFPLPDKVA
jgi:PAS domain S-box-containing protein